MDWSALLSTALGGALAMLGGVATTLLGERTARTQERRAAKKEHLEQAHAAAYEVRRSYQELMGWCVERINSDPRKPVKKDRSTLEQLRVLDMASSFYAPELRTAFEDMKEAMLECFGPTLAETITLNESADKAARQEQTFKVMRDHSYVERKIDRLIAAISEAGRTVFD